MSPLGIEYLQHVLAEAAYLTAQTRGMSRDVFMEDDTLKRAFVRSLEVIGEAVKHVPQQLRDKYDQVEWRAIAGMRDRLIHEYFGVDYELVWDAAVNQVPQLREEIQQIVDRESGEGKH